MEAPKEKEKDREREREFELEAAMYTNCLLLGLDASVFGQSGGPRTGLFRHSNPRMGETLLHFLLCALRGPVQSAKDFAGVWPIFDAAQSRDFRKIVQGLINELESQGALPRSNSRVSSLATCCGQRFVELLWQLSAHALREVHKRTFTADVAANPLPASLTEVVNQSSHASTLVAVTKARIALERRRFLEGAASAVQRQASWSSLAHDMTAEFRGLCAEEAYLHQELEKVQDLKNSKAKLDDEVLDGGISHPTDQKPLSVSRASRLWESLLIHTTQHEELASGPIEDLIAHREHRYRISGSLLRAAIDHSSNASPLDSLSSQDLSQIQKRDDEWQTGSFQNFFKERHNLSSLQIEEQINEESYPKDYERGGKGSPVVDVAEILRRWTHALQRIHKQFIRLARSNDGAGPELLKYTAHSGGNAHAESLQTALVEHHQHLANIQALIGQLKDVTPTMEATISTLREEVNRMSIAASTMRLRNVFGSSSRCQSRAMEVNDDQSAEANLKIVPAHLELIPPTPALKLPQLFSLSSSVSGKDTCIQRNHTEVPEMHTLEILPECDKANGISPTRRLRHEDPQVNGNYDLSVLRQSVREAALSKSAIGLESLRESIDRNTEHYFIPLSSTSTFALSGADKKTTVLQQKLHVFRSLEDSHKFRNGSVADNGKDCIGMQSERESDGHLNNHNLSVSENYTTNGYLSVNDLKSASSTVQENYICEAEKAVGHSVRPFSPPLLMELTSFPEAYDDLLAPMSEVEAALMECSMQTMHA